MSRANISVVEPATVTRFQSGRLHHNPKRGKPGFEVAVYRKFLTPTPHRELVSRDSYPARNRIMWQ